MEKQFDLEKYITEQLEASSPPAYEEAYWDEALEVIKSKERRRWRYLWWLLPTCFVGILALGYAGYLSNQEDGLAQAAMEMAPALSPQQGELPMNPIEENTLNAPIAKQLNETSHSSPQNTHMQPISTPKENISTITQNTSIASVSPIEPSDQATAAAPVSFDQNKGLLMSVEQSRAGEPQPIDAPQVDASQESSWAPALDRDENRARFTLNISQIAPNQSILSQADGIIPTSRELTGVKNTPPFLPQVHVYVMAGVRVLSNYPAAEETGSSWQFQPEVGLGTHYRFHRRFALELEATLYQRDEIGFTLSSTQTTRVFQRETTTQNLTYDQMTLLNVPLRLKVLVAKGHSLSLGGQFTRVLQTAGTLSSTRESMLATEAYVTQRSVNGYTAGLRTMDYGLEFGYGFRPWARWEMNLLGTWGLRSVTDGQLLVNEARNRSIALGLKYYLR
ncbi:MAG: outer membrane beta-barrel protein [Bacteroidota bacterium]